MNADDLTRRQSLAVKIKLEPMREYLHKLRTRMIKRGFPPGDPLYLLVTEAQRAIGELYMGVSMRAFGGPINAPPEKQAGRLDQRSARKLHDRR